MSFFGPPHPTRRFAAGVACVGVVSLLLFLLRDETLPAVTALLALVTGSLLPLTVSLWLYFTVGLRVPLPGFRFSRRKA